MSDSENSVSVNYMLKYNFTHKSNTSSLGASLCLWANKCLCPGLFESFIILAAFAVIK